MMTNKGKIISKAIVGYNKNPGTHSIQSLYHQLKILLYEIKNKAEIRSLIQ